jgi:lipoprotein-anchoring transpeptidase ErfK/SrfK
VKEAKVVAGGRPVDSAFQRADLAAPAHGPQRVKRPKGERGSSVRAVQERLAELRYLPRSAVDGVDGYRTQQAVIAFQSWRGLERDGVVGPLTRAALAKASPPSPHADGPPRRIEVYREKGVALLIRGGETVRAIHVSTGGPGNETPAGRFEIFRKELRSWSVPFQTWLPYASYFNNGIAFHEYPDVPPYPASHGCVRVPSPEAKGVYRFARMGTAVVVF